MQKSKAQKNKEKEIALSKNPKEVKVKEKKKFIDGRTHYIDEIIEIVITSSDFWYSGMEGAIFSVFKSIDGRKYKTVDKAVEGLFYGIINSCDCNEITKEKK